MPVLTLIRTAPDFPPGSMPAYAQLVSQAFADREDSEFEIRTIDFFDPQGGGSMRRHHFWRLRHARRLFAENPSDLYHLLDGSMVGLLPSTVWKKTVVTVHDLIPLLQCDGRLPGRPSPAARWLIRRAVQALQQVAGLASVSEYTRRDLLEYTGRLDVEVIPLAIRDLPETGDAELALPEHYLFHVGNNADYKNRAGVLDVFARLQEIPDLHLLMAGPEPSPQLRQKAAALQRVRFLVDVTDEELADLYRNAGAFLFPSLYEGFGMPVLEAMRAGCPVVCSSAASLPEVAGGAAQVASPEEIGLLANHCRTLLANPSCRDEWIQRGVQRAGHFTMERLSGALRAWYIQNLNQTGDL